jgi:hypothetical protein
MKNPQPPGRNNSLSSLFLKQGLHGHLFNLAPPKANREHTKQRMTKREKIIAETNCETRRRHQKRKEFYE